MRTVEFYRILDADNMLRVRFDTERGHVLSFTVQHEEWQRQILENQLMLSKRISV